MDTHANGTDHAPITAIRHTSRRRFLLSVAATSVAAILAACGETTPAPSPTGGAAPVAAVTPQATSVVIPAATAVTVASGGASTVAPAAMAMASPAVAGQRGGTLNIGVAGDIRSLDPYGTNLGVWSLMRYQLYDTLFWQDPVTTQLVPNLATEWAFTDPRTLAITLRDDVTFHSGAKFGAEDVKFTLDYITNPNNPTGEFKTRLRALDSVEVIDATHVRLRLKEPDAAVPFVLSNFFILAKGDAATITTGKPNGTGAFKYVDWQQNNFFKVERNANYWRKDRPLLDAVVFKVIPQAETRIASLQSGQIDFIYQLDLKDVPALKGKGGINVAVTMPADGFWRTYLNTRRAPLSDVRVRQAVLYAFDRQGFARDFAAGLAKPSNTPLFEEHWAFNADVQSAYPYDLKKAAQLLTDAGLQGGKGLKLQYIYPSGYPDFKNAGLLIQAALSELGGQVDVKELELATWTARITKDLDFDISLDTASGGTGDPAVLYGYDVMLAPSPTNFNGLTEDKLPEYTQLIKMGAAVTDQAQRVPIYKKLQQIWIDQVPGWVVAHRAVAFALTPKVTNFVAPTSGRLRLMDVALG